MQHNVQSPEVHLGKLKLNYLGVSWRNLVDLYVEVD